LWILSTDDFFYFFNPLLRKLEKSGWALVITCKVAEQVLISYIHLMPCHTTCAGNLNWIGTPPSYFFSW